ncbi:MAG: hypothetical protein AB1610_01455 [Nitrospirota bacterium]
MFTIRTKIIIWGSGFVLLAVVLGIFNLWTQNRIIESTKILETQMEKHSLICDLQLAINEAIMPGNDYIITGKSGYKDEFDRLDSKVKKLLAEIKGSLYFTEEEKETVRKTGTLYEGVKDMSYQIFSKDYRASGLEKLMEKMDYEYAAPAIEKVNFLKEGIGKSPLLSG